MPKELVEDGLAAEVRGIQSKLNSMGKAPMIRLSLVHERKKEKTHMSRVK